MIESNLHLDCTSSKWNQFPGDVTNFIIMAVRVPGTTKEGIMRALLLPADVEEVMVQGTLVWEFKTQLCHHHIL